VTIFTLGVGVSFFLIAWHYSSCPHYNYLHNSDHLYNSLPTSYIFALACQTVVCYYVASVTSHYLLRTITEITLRWATGRWRHLAPVFMQSSQDVESPPYIATQGSLYIQGKHSTIPSNQKAHQVLLNEQLKFWKPVYWQSVSHWLIIVFTGIFLTILKSQQSNHCTKRRKILYDKQQVYSLLTAVCQILKKTMYSRGFGSYLRDRIQKHGNQII